MILDFTPNNYSERFERDVYGYRNETIEIAHSAETAGLLRHIRSGGSPLTFAREKIPAGGMDYIMRLWPDEEMSEPGAMK